MKKISKEKFNSLPRSKKEPVPYSTGTDSKIEYVLSSGEDEVGVVRGGGHLCGLEGCGCSRISVVWADGKRTMPCLGGMEETSLPGVWKIIAPF